jgi:hypothetical protein
METLMRYNFFQKDGENFIVIFISRKKENKGRPSFLNKNRAKNHVDTLQLLSTFFPSNQSRTEISVSTLPSVMVAGVTRSAACRCQSMSAACHADLGLV